MLLFGMSYICLQIFQLIGISHTHFLSYNPLVIYIGQYLFILCLQATIFPFKDYTSGLSLISFGLRGYCLGVLPVFLMYRIARLSSKVGSVTVRTSSSLAFSVLSALLDSPTSSS